MTYVRFDLIVYHQNLDKLKKFTKLRRIVFSHNYLNSFILLSKIEVSFYQKPNPIDNSASTPCRA